MFFFLRHAKFFSAFAVLVILAIILTAVFYNRSADDPWKEFKAKHGKDYEEFKDGGKEDASRKQIFLTTDAKIQKHNSLENVTYQLGHNKFSDMTAEELTKYLGAVQPANENQSLPSTIRINMTDGPLPTSLDYRTHRCLPAVKNQRNCGSCWAFSAIAPLEFAQCKKTGVPVVLSEQQLVDCDPYNSGCEGGWPTDAWKYLKNLAGGSAKQSLYPYTATESTCKYTSSMSGAKISSFGSLATLDSFNMQLGLQSYGPISVAISVAKSFFSYKSGVYNDVTCDNLGISHAVVVVGWGTLNGLNYWIVRNSWGSDWGMNGYILIQRGVNKCKIEKHPAVIQSVV